MKKIVEGIVVRLKGVSIIVFAVVLTIISFVTIAVDTPTTYAKEKDKSITILFTHDMLIIYFRYNHLRMEWQ